MRFPTAAGLLACLLAFSASAGAQSLGSVAKKERERREKNKREGVAAREFSEQEVFGAEDESEPASGEAEAAPKDAAEPLIPEGELESPEGDPDAGLESESRDRRRSEAEWRTRAQSARSRIASARERVEMLDGLSLAQGERYVDVNGNTVVESVEHLQRLVGEGREELASAERAWKELQEEARRAGVPPGWLR